MVADPHDGLGRLESGAAIAQARRLSIYDNTCTLNSSKISLFETLRLPLRWKMTSKKITEFIISRVVAKAHQLLLGLFPSVISAPAGHAESPAIRNCNWCYGGLLKVIRPHRAWPDRGSNISDIRLMTAQAAM